MQRNGAQILIECLIKEGVDFIFGYPGGSVLDIYDELPKYPQLRHILVRHEQGAVHAADGYARATGKVGACLVTSGPGATNTVTGIATAYCDSIPVVIFTGQVTTNLIGNDAFQEIDIAGITRPCTKHNYVVLDVNDLAKTVRQAFYLARSGRPGPVLVDLPRNVMQAVTEFVWPEDVSMRSYNPTYRPNFAQIRRVVDEICESKKPLLFGGGGVINSNSSEAFCKLAKTFSIPVTTSLMGLGAFPGDDPLWLGMLGMHGTFAANNAISNTDLLLAVGVRFDDRVTSRISAFAPKATIVHIDIDPTSIHKNVNVRTPVVGDCKHSLEAILEQMEKRPEFTQDWHAAHADWIQQVTDWKKEHPITWTAGDKIKPQQVIEMLDRLLKDDDIITTDVGQHQMWVAQMHTFRKPRTMITSGGLGTMGYGFPASIGAQLAFPNKKVVCVSGDGSFQMNMQEMIVAVSNKLPIKILLLNNQCLGMVRQLQYLFCGKRFNAVDLTAQPDFVQLARAFGAEGYRIEKVEDLESTLQKAFVSSSTALIDVHVFPEEIVYPTVPTGAALNEMLL